MNFQQQLELYPQTEIQQKIANTTPAQIDLALQEVAGTPTLVHHNFALLFWMSL